jgi:hypothetical protein
MVNVLGVWLALFGIVVGWGLLVVWLLRRFLGASVSSPLGTLQAVWLGYAALQCFLQLASFGFAINNLVFALSCLPAVAGYALLHRTLIERGRTALSQRLRVTLVVAVVALLTSIVVAYSACNDVAVYDTGLYHLQAVKWMTRYPVVPGLGNLHMRFGYNNSVHLFGAYVDTLWEGVAAHIANGFLLACALSQWFTEIFTARTPRGRVRQVYCLLTLPWLLAKIWGGEVSSLSTDLPLMIFSFVFVLELLSLPWTSRDRLALPLALIVTLAAVATTTKLGGMALLVVSGVIVVVFARKELISRRWSLALALPAVLVLGWLARGIILSGWLVYPVFGHLPLSWSVPQRLATLDYGNIQSWSRMQGTGPEVLAAHGFWWWFGPWLDTFRASREFMLLVVSSALLAWRTAHGPGRSAVRAAGEWGAIAACLVGILEWMTGAPDLRYGNFWFWMLPAVLFAPMVADGMRNAHVRVGVVAFSIALCAWAGGFAFHETVSVPKLWGRPPAPQRAKTTHNKTGQTDVLVPTTDDRCFDEPLPCTPQPGIQSLRDPADLGAGFESVPTSP